VIIKLRNRPFSVRLWNSYLLWRRYLPVWQAVCAAWRTSK
jgi:hypothetical protein